MKTCTKCDTAKPLSGFSRQAKGKFGVTSICKGCSSARGKSWHQANREKSLSQKRAYREANLEKVSAASAAWRKANADRCRATAAAWCSANAEKKSAAAAKRRAALLQAIPIWADLDRIKIIYRWAREATHATGIEFQVDHLYPLQSAVVCGLHCWDNLVIRTASSNKSKGNRL
ncbi:MAG: hypothetical protein EOP24_26240 [Hyphomicrobiales bacterium]|nr:MAG: hypothetical protein EOP24_26240 [Hyphomicrobiales bacterium]